MKKLGLALFILFIVYFIFLIRQDIMDNLDLKYEMTRLKEVIQQGNAKTSELKTDLQKLETDDYVEELARARLGLVKKGEVAYKVVVRR